MKAEVAVGRQCLTSMGGRREGEGRSCLHHVRWLQVGVNLFVSWREARHD